MDAIAVSLDRDRTVRLILKIQAALDQLAFPVMGKSGRVEAPRELVTSGTPYIVVYRVKGKTVEILRVLHSSKSYLD